MLKVVNTDVCKDVEQLSHQFLNATPFPHIFIDNFLHEELAEKLLTEFPDISLMHRSHHYLFTQKHELSFWAKTSDLFSQLHQDLLSDEIRHFVSLISGQQVFMDSDFCGELHQGTNGSFLDMHLDFNLHPTHDNWVHELTLLIYLNKNWQYQYGGQLQLQQDETGKIYEVDPIFNRCAIIRCCDAKNFHGYRQLKLPDGVTRKSILVNFYREVAPEQAPPRRPTIWATKKVSPVKAFLAKIYNPIATLKHRLFGLTTAGDRGEAEKIKERNQNKS